MVIALTTAISAVCLIICAYQTGRLEERARTLKIIRKTYDQVHDDFGGLAVTAMSYVLGELLNEVEADHHPVPGP